MKTITMSGNLGKDAVPSKQPNTVTFTIGVKDSFNKDRTDWFTCYFPLNKGFQQDWLVKGKYIDLVGALYFQEGKDGKTYSNVNVFAIGFPPISNVKKSEEGGSISAPITIPFPEPSFKDDLPF